MRDYPPPVNSLVVVSISTCGLKRLAKKFKLVSCKFEMPVSVFSGAQCLGNIDLIVSLGNLMFLST